MPQPATNQSTNVTLSFAARPKVDRRGNLTISARAVEKSGNRKLTANPRSNPISVTYASQLTCSDTCPLKPVMIDGTLHLRGCYGNDGHAALITRRQNAAATAYGRGPVQIAHEMAAAIDRLSGRYPLRLNVVGDCDSDAAARIVSAAAERYQDRGEALTGIRPHVWAYTHSWRTVDRPSWGQVSVLASCETDHDVAHATARGYAIALVRAHEDLPREIAGLRTVPCPQQTGAKADCASCRICWKADRLHAKAIVVFDPHGDAQTVRESLARRLAE